MPASVSKPHFKEDRNEEFDALYQRHSGEVFALAYARWKNPDTAMEVMQETFLRLWKQLEAGEMIFNARAWLLRVARNLAKDHGKSAFRRNGTSGPEEMSGVEAHGPSPFECACRDEEAAALRATLATLPARDRALLVMHIIWRMTFREIEAKILLPRSTICGIIHRALRLLEQRLAHLRDAD